MLVVSGFKIDELFGHQELVQWLGFRFKGVGGEEIARWQTTPDICAGGFGIRG